MGASFTGTDEGQDRLGESLTQFSVPLDRQMQIVADFNAVFIKTIVQIVRVYPGKLWSGLSHTYLCLPNPRPVRIPLNTISGCGQL